ncbi:hypothetical protein [Sandaracinus amylolyticus]|nr:hypothetical protein [Sandaracinus amylolyticus]
MTDNKNTEDYPFALHVWPDRTEQWFFRDEQKSDIQTVVDDDNAKHAVGR